MPSINILSKSVAELIAAGEVVERPSSAIKELIENSIDAGGRKITVEIKNGGISYIRVTDDGCGISREDVPKAFISHATSKISTADDLNSIFTLGFRGEALASIAAVARVEMLTKTAAEDFGTRYVIEGGTEVLCDDAGCPDGTTIVVRNLFFNTPARMKFLKKDSTEGNYVSDVVARIAVANPKVSVRLIKDGKQTIFTPGDGKLISAVSAVYGKEFAESMIPCDYELGGIKVGGFVSLPGKCRATRNSQYFYVNSRFVKIPVGAAALDGAYKNTVMVGKFPACVINLTVPPETVDVNVHPAKTEVRFSDDKRIFDAVYYAAKNAVSTGDVRPKADLSFAASSHVLKGEQVDFGAAQKFYKPTEKTAASAKSENPHEKENTYKPEIKSHYNDGILKNDRTKDFMREFLKPLRDSESSGVLDPIGDGGALVLESGDAEKAAALPRDEDDGLSLKRASSVNIDISPGDEAARDDAHDTQADEEPQKPYYRYLGEAFKTYLFAETEDKVLIIDKHALHERMLFNEIKAGGVCSSPQALLSPETVRLDRREYAAITENTEALSSIGFSIEDFGEGTVIVRECPMMFTGDNLADIISELAAELMNHASELMTEKLDWLYHSAACRAAVKGGNPLPDSDARLLIEKVLSDKEFMYCPHGRPVLIELTRKELEKQFGRIQ